MKILVQPIDINHLYELNKKDIHGFIIGIKNYSIFQNLKLSIEELKEIKIDKEIYISLNKPIHNNELESIKESSKSEEQMTIQVTPNQIVIFAVVIAAVVAHTCVVTITFINKKSKQ